MLRTVKLHGLARKHFGQEFVLDVGSVAEAVRALTAQLPGFREFLAQHYFRVVVGKSTKTGFVLGEDQIDFKLPDGELHIVPVMQGAKSGGVGKVVAGIVLLAVAFFVPFAVMGATTLSAAMGMSVVGGFTFGNLAVLGVGMIAAGVSQMITAQDKTNQSEKSNNESFMLDGAVNVTEQGGPVPLVYGKAMVGSVLISAGLETVDIPVN